MDTLRGQLLIAGPGLHDPNFHRTVILVGEHGGDDGALGVVLNRPAPLSVAEVVPPLAGLAGEGAPIFIGGPVQPQGIVLLAEFQDPADADLLVFDSIGFLIGEVPSESAEGIRRARVFAGYAGWAPGQLEREVEEAAWIIEAALPDDIFGGRPERLWSSVLDRKGGDFRLLATMPPDPSLN